MKKYLVTGAAQGIGQAIAERLLQDEDASLIVIDKQSSKFIENCQSRFGDRFTFHLQDVADRDGLESVLAEVGREQLLGIINNAGEVYLEKWDKLQMTTWDRTLAVNVTAPLHIVHSLRHALQPGTSVVNIASTDGIRAAYDTVAYAASKAALMNLTQSLAANLGPRGIRVNAVAPGWVETAMVVGTLPEEASEMTHLGRNAKPVEIAETVFFLLSDNASFITGTTLVADGGLTNVDYTIKKEAGL